MQQSAYVYDLFIIGGGINGVGIARDAAGRGLKVGLCEQQDIGWATSSASSKLIHGGLRYLENYEFRLVREALSEREVLLDIAPHLVRPLLFVLPHEPHLRPAWMLRIGLFIYDHLAKRSERLPGSHGFKFKDQKTYATPLKKSYKKGFVYSDCQVDDSRLVLLNAIDAKNLGADIKTRTQCKAIERFKDHWKITLEQEDGTLQTVESKILINAAGPWIEQVQHLIKNIKPNSHLRLVKGSHIIVPKIYPDYHAYILQNKDGRIVFMTPHQDHFTMIGTTDLDYQGNPAKVHIEEKEIDYLLELINIYLEKPLTRADIVGSWSGVRPLYDDDKGNASTITRDYVFDVSGDGHNNAVLLCIFGGKLTTYRRLAEHALDQLSSFLPSTQPWTATQHLPGGQLPDSPEKYTQMLCQRYTHLDPQMIARYVRSYGTLAEKILDQAKTPQDLGTHFGHGLYEHEVRWMITHEWAKTAQDILWRRSKLGLHFNQEQTHQLSQWIKTNT